MVFEILEREKKKNVSGLLQITFVLIGFAVMVCIEVFGQFQDDIFFLIGAALSDL